MRELRCCAGSRLLVQESIAEPFVERLKDRLSTLRVGDPLDKNTDVGAINNAAQLAKIEELMEVGVAEGAAAAKNGPAPTASASPPAAEASQVPARNSASGGALNAFSVDIAKAIDHNAAVELWERHGRGEKIIVFKKKRRKQYKRTKGHRQNYTEIKIDKI